MAGKTAILSVRIIADAKDAKKGFTETAEASKKMEDGLNKAAIGSAAVVAGLAVLAKSSFDAASALQQSTGAVEAVFDAHADGVKRLAEQAAENVGLATSEYQDMSVILGSQLKNMGMPMDDVAGQTEELIGLGSDLAATFGGTTSDAVAALSSLLRGERDPIERYGVSIKQATINAKLAEMGLADLEGEARTAAESQATLALLTEQTAAAHGMFAAEADTAAGAQQRANAQWQNAQAELGTALLPIVTDVTRILSEMAVWVADNSDLVLTLAAGVGTLAAGVLLVKGALEAYRAITAIATAAQIAWNIAVSANPIGVIILAIAALVAVIVWLIVNWETVAAVASDVLDGIVAGIQDVIGWIEGMIGWIRDAIGWLGSLFGAQNDARAAGEGFGGDDDPTIPPGVPPFWTAADDALLAAYIGGDPDDPDGTGGWPTWAATPTTGASDARVGDTYNIRLDGVLDIDGAARQIEDVLQRHARRTGRPLTAIGGETTWR